MGSQRKDLTRFIPLLALAVVLSLCLGLAEAATTLQKPVKLEWHYYRIHNTCKDAEIYVRHQVNESYANDKSIVAKLLRLASTDCLVTVSVLLSRNLDQPGLFFFCFFFFFVIFIRFVLQFLLL